TPGEALILPLVDDLRSPSVPARASHRADQAVALALDVFDQMNPLNQSRRVQPFREGHAWWNGHVYRHLDRRAPVQPLQAALEHVSPAGRCTFDRRPDGTGSRSNRSANRELRQLLRRATGNARHGLARALTAAVGSL